MYRRSGTARHYRRSFLIVAVGMFSVIAAVCLTNRASAQLLDVIESDEGWIYKWDPNFEMISEGHASSVFAAAGSSKSFGDITGPVAATTATPEPSALMMAVLSCFALLGYGRRWRKDPGRPSL